MTRIRVEIEGIAGIIHHSAAGVDPLHPSNKEKGEITSKTGSKRTEADEQRIREIETKISLWLDEEGNPTIPKTAIRTCIETGARRLKQGPNVREGLIVKNTKFKYDTKRYGTTMEEWEKSLQFTVPVVVQRARILRTRALFEPPWSCIFEIEGDKGLVDAPKLEQWLEIGGTRIGLGGLEA